jgi:CRISPR-associated protein Cst2
VFYLHGSIVTRYGCASLNHGQQRGNISPVQKCPWFNDIHSTVNADALRWSMRYFLQLEGYNYNRKWNPETFNYEWQDKIFNPEIYIDDDIFGYARFESGKQEESDNTVSRRGALGVTRAISLTPFTGTITFNATAGRNKGKDSLHGLEYHNTRYQYNFSVNANDLKDSSRIFPLMDAIMNIPQVGGNSNVFSYDFSPSSMILRWTNKIAPNIYYAFEPSPNSSQEVYLTNDVIDEIELHNLSNEFWIGGSIAKSFSSQTQAHIIPSRSELFEQLKEVIAEDLDLQISPPSVVS